MFYEDEDNIPIGLNDSDREPDHDNMHVPIEERLAIGRAEGSHANGGIVPFPSNARSSVLDALRGEDRKKAEGYIARGYTLTAYEYRDSVGDPFFAIIRGDHATERKLILPLRYCGKGSSGLDLFWFTAIPGTRPLQGLDQLAARPADPVLVVEGEKAAAAARQSMPGHVVVTWPGGASANVIKRVDMSALAGRTVVGWPDNDEPGRNGMRVFGAYALTAGAASYATVVVPREFPKKWDLADELSDDLRAEFPFQHLIETAKPMTTAQAAMVLQERETKSARRLLGHDVGHSRVERSDVETALNFLDPDTSGIWRVVGRCLYFAFGKAGLELFDAWSQRGDKYRNGEPGRLWEEYAREPHFNGRSLAWLFRKAKRVEEDDSHDPTKKSNATIDDEAYTLAHIEELNCDHAVVTRGSKTAVMWESYDARFDRFRLDFLKKGDFQDKVIRKVPIARNKNGDTQYQPLGKLWFGSMNRRQYDGIVFMPGQYTGPNLINTWKGFAVHPVNDRDGWSLLKQHLLENVCQGDQAAYDYIMNWLAAGVQWLDRPVGTALVLTGQKGAGKSILIELFGKLFAEHSYVTSHSEDIVGRFNAHLEETVLLGVEEAFAPQNRAADGTLKDLITRRTLRIEDKFFSTWTAPNHLRIIMTSNNDQVVRADGSDRRYAVFDVTNPHQYDPDGRRRYFGDMVEQMETGGYEAMLGELLERDVSNWNPEVIPETDALRRQKLLNLSSNPVEAWLYSRLEDGVNILSGEADTGVYPWSETETTWVPVREVIADYSEFAKRHGHRGDERRLAVKLARYMPTGFKGQTRSRSGVDGPVKGRMYPFPPLPEAKRLFEDATGYKID